MILGGNGEEQGRKELRVWESLTEPFLLLEVTRARGSDREALSENQVSQQRQASVTDDEKSRWQDRRGCLLLFPPHAKARQLRGSPVRHTNAQCSPAQLGSRCRSEHPKRSNSLGSLSAKEAPTPQAFVSLRSQAPSPHCFHLSVSASSPAIPA